MRDVQSLEGHGGGISGKWPCEQRGGRKSQWQGFTHGTRQSGLVRLRKVPGERGFAVPVKWGCGGSEQVGEVESSILEGLICVVMCRVDGSRGNGNLSGDGCGREK